MSQISTFAKILADAGLGTLGQDIFYFSSPEGISKCILVLDNLQGTGIDENLPGYRQAEFRVVVRDTDYDQAMTTAGLVANALDFHRETHDNLVFQRCTPMQDPYAYPVPDSDNIEVVVNCWACYVIT